MGVTVASPWTWYLMVPVFIWIYRVHAWWFERASKRKPSEPGEPLLKSVKESLALVEHQIWLMRSIFGGTVLPTGISMLAFFAHVSCLHWHRRLKTGWTHLVDLNAFTFAFFVVLAVYASIYFLNQRVVRTQYEPRRQELLTLLASLTDETTSEVSGEYPLLMSEERVKCSCSSRRMFVAFVCFVAILLIGIGVIFLASSLDQARYSKKSPFAAVRWQQSQPEVKVGDEWFKLVSLDEILASEIVAFSQRTYGNKWQKRFEEDLVELLTRMGHPPQDTVTLVVQSLASQETQTLEDVPMTRANRRAIWDAAQARELDAEEE